MGCGQSSKESASNPKPHVERGGSTESCEEGGRDYSTITQSLAATRLSGTVSVTGRYHISTRLQEDYTANKKQVLGSGQNGTVYGAVAKQGGYAVAVKDFHYRNLNERSLQELQKECEIFLGMDHPKIVRLYDVYQGPNKLTLIMEAMSGGTLLDRLCKKGASYSAEAAADASYQMLLSINHLHEKLIVHRDIKLENYLYERPENQNLKLIDFGFSRSFDVDVQMKTNLGTLPYCAPEVLKKNYNNKCDLWSLGISVFVLLAGSLPFSGKDVQDTMRNICARKFDANPTWDIVTKENPIAAEFVMRLLVTDPAERSSAGEALQHKFLEQSEIVARHDKIAAAGVGKELLANLHAYTHASKFRRAVMSAMAWSLSQEERKELKGAFIAMDADRNGTVSLDEFKTAVAKNFNLTDAEITDMFHSPTDTWRDRLDYSDFLAALLSTSVDIHGDLVYAAFRKFDKDGSGFIEAAELKEVFQDCNSDEDIQLMIKEADPHGTGRIAYKDFVEFARAQTGERTEMLSKLIDREIRTGTDEAAIERRESRNDIDGVEILRANSKPQMQHSIGEGNTAMI